VKQQQPLVVERWEDDELTIGGDRRPPRASHLLSRAVKADKLRSAGPPVAEEKVEGAIRVARYEVARPRDEHDVAPVSAYGNIQWARWTVIVALFAGAGEAHTLDRGMRGRRACEEK